MFWTFNDRARRRPRLALAGVAAGRAHRHPGPDQRRVAGVLRGGLRRRPGARVCARRRTPRIPQLALLVVVGFLLVNKVYSPQYVLWLLPLVALARPRWRDVLIWTAGEVFYFAAVWLYLGGWTASGGERPAGPVLLARDRGPDGRELYVAVVVVRDVLAALARPGPQPTASPTTPPNRPRPCLA